MTGSVELDIRTKKGTKVSSVVFDKKLITIGKASECDIPLMGWRVSKVHARILLTAKGVFIESVEGGKNILINGDKYEEYGPLVNGEILEIGDYLIKVILLGDALTSRNKPTEQVLPSITLIKAAAVTRESVNSSASSRDVPTLHEETITNLPALIDPNKLAKKDLSQVWRLKIHQQLFELMDLRRVNVHDMDDSELRSYTSKTIEEVLSGFSDWPNLLDKKEISRQVLCEAVGLGPLEDLLDNEDISEVMVNAHDEIFYELKGKLLKSEITFTDDKSVMSAIERIVSPIGRRIDESSPLVDARLKDGSRVNAIIPPLALKGPSITIRKFMKERLRAENLISFGSVSEQMVSFLETAIVRKRNVVISGGTGSGKTTLLNVLSNFIPDNERIVTVEDAAELKLYQPNLVALEARPPNQEGKGAVSIRELVKNCLRMRPDRIVVGECRGGEALDMLQAMNTGHDGSLTTIHSNSPRDCISRLEVLVLMSGMELPVRAIREQIASAVHIIVQQTRFSCGTRKVTSITEVTGVEGEVVQLAEIFKYKQSGYDENGKVTGYFEATGIVPEFYEDLRRRGIDVDLSAFNREADL